jgi:hypothetical protein
MLLCSRSAAPLRSTNMYNLEIKNPPFPNIKLFPPLMCLMKWIHCIIAFARSPGTFEITGLRLLLQWFWQPWPGRTVIGNPLFCMCLISRAEFQRLLPYYPVNSGQNKNHSRAIHSKSGHWQMYYRGSGSKASPDNKQMGYPTCLYPPLAQAAILIIALTLLK